MTRVVTSIAKWVPAIIVLAVLVVVGIRYKSEIAAWFGPMVHMAADRYVSANPDGPFSDAMEGSMTKGETMGGAGGPSNRVHAGPFEIEAHWEPEVPRVGENWVTLEVRDLSGLPLEGALLQVLVKEPIALTETSPGAYHGPLNLDMEGEWDILGDVRTVDMRHADFVLKFATDVSGVSITSATASPGRGDGDIAYWTCSMHPSVRSEGPGKCPICAMDLVSVTREEVETGVIMVDAQRQQLIGVKTGIVRRERVTKTIRAAGMVLPDETKLTDITLKLDAWIGTVHADFTGKPVRMGEPLFTFYSPELWSAQEELLEAVRRSNDGASRNNRLAEVAETRLLLWGIDSSTIEAIKQRGKPFEHVPFMSPATGTVMIKNIVEGSAVQAGAMLYRIADLTTLWIEADVYESEVSIVELGQIVDVTLAYMPGHQFQGTVSYIFPYLNDSTRTARIRIDVPNADGRLKPAMYANANLAIPLGERLIVPESAVIYAGKNCVAFVDLGEGRFQPRTITTGIRDEDWIEVLDGLASGETVVTSANFLIAAESKLKSGLDKW